jgi:pilus assembly protein CpaC
MKWFLPFLFIISLPAESSELWLKVGETRTLPASAEAVVRVVARGVVRAVDTGAGLKIIGLKPGTSSLAVDGASYLVRVSYSSDKDFAVGMRSAIGKMMGLKFHSDQKQFVVTGTLLRFADWLYLAELARRSGGEYSFRAHPLPDVAEEAMEHLRGLASKNGFPVVRFSADEGQFRVHIPQGANSLRAAVERVYKPFGIAVDVSGADLAVAPLIRTRVILAELSKSYSQEIGVQWPGEYKAQLIPRFKDADGLMVTLRALEAQGHAQILASPTLLCRSGGQAQFHAGGEFPIRIFSRTSRDVLWKQHGVILNVKPKADFQGAMSIEVETEISLLDMAHAVDGVPALKKNRVKSQFDLPGKRTIALSGLLRQELGESKEGLPFLTGLPVLGPLFSSQKFLNHQTELVVFVTPEIHTPDSDDPLQMPEGWVQNGR